LRLTGPRVYLSGRDIPECLTMTDLPHEPHGLSPPTLENWLIAFGTALVALIAIGVLPRIWG
jgi:hypothetical protein